MRNRTEAAKLLRDAEFLEPVLPKERGMKGVDANGLAVDRALDSGAPVDGLQRRASRGPLVAFRQEERRGEEALVAEL